MYQGFMCQGFMGQDITGRGLREFMCRSESGEQQVLLSLTSRQWMPGTAGSLETGSHAAGSRAAEGGGVTQTTSEYDALYHYDPDGGGHVFRYEEKDPESGAATAAQMRISDRKMVIERSGAVRAVIELIPGQETPCLYETAYGTIPMTFRTTELRIVESGKKCGILRDDGQGDDVSAAGREITARVFYRILQDGTETLRCAVTVRAQVTR